MKTFDIVIKGTIVKHDGIIKNGFVAINGSKIAQIGLGKVPKSKVFYDQSNSFIMPGGVDSQVHSYSQLDREGFEWSTKSAASGGITTIVDMPYDANALICNENEFNKKINKINTKARVDVALYATIDPNEGSKRIKELVEAGAIGFKFSTFGTDPKRFPRIPNYMLFECFKEISKYGLIAGVHNENDEAVNYYLNKVKNSNIKNYEAHILSRPKITETLAIAEIYELAHEAKCRGHVVHCSTSRGYEMCENYKKQGANTTIEACIHYLILNHDEDVPKLQGLSKCNPPIRSKKEMNALWEHFKKGNITVVSTDHVSWALDKKNNPEMLKNSSGMPSLEVLYPLLLTQCHRRGIPLEKAVETVAYNPAKLFNFDDKKGSLDIGKDADVAIFDYNPYVYNPRESGNNISNWSSYEGKKIDFRLSKTFLRGELICNNSNVLAKEGNGKFLRPTRGLKT